MNDEDFYNNIHNYLKEWKDFKDLALTHKKLNQLQSNWNSLREWLEKVSQEEPMPRTEHFNWVYNNVLDKMNELEGKDK